MSWQEERAARRIRLLLESAPEVSIQVTDFGSYMSERFDLRETARRRGETFSEPIFAVPHSRAITTHGSHIYANLMDFNDVLIENDRETEASHRKAYEFLHAQYAACDQLIAAFDIQRVDFHGSRLHAVVLTPSGDNNERLRLEKAVSFAAAYRVMVARLGEDYGNDFRTRVRIGIDTGAAVAINSGNRDEPEPLFIGSPANHAAKLAEGDVAGIFLSPRAQRVRSGLTESVGTELATMIDSLREGSALDNIVLAHGHNSRARDRIDEAYSSFAREREAIIGKVADARNPVFKFHYRQPPLRTIVFSDHPPSNSIRQPMVSVFADIDGFTAYIDAAIASGTVAQAVSNLHVMRGEMNNVLQQDFSGRKVRFIGDCLQGLIAEGTANATDLCASVRSAVMAAGGIRSSFNLCRDILPGAAALGIGIGLELGETPISRLGLRGSASVRCATSRSTCISEEIQHQCNGRETCIGEDAYHAGDAKVQTLFRNSRRISNLSYSAASTLLLGATSTVAAAPAIQAVREPLRAYAN